MKVKSFNTILLILLSAVLIGQNPISLNQELNVLFEQDPFKQSNISLSVLALEDEEAVCQYRSDKNLIPASSLKLLPNLIALQTLGPNYKFKTDISYSGQIEHDGTLIGDLIIKGSGDPTLGSHGVNGALPFDNLFNTVVARINQAGITCIDGNIILDTSGFEGENVSSYWQWNDIGNYYASGSWPINIKENFYSITFNNNSSVGSCPNISNVNPFIPNLTFDNKLKIDKSNTGDQAYIFGGPSNYNKTIRGTIPRGKGAFKIQGSIPNPTLFFGQHLQNVLLQNNIQINDVVISNETDETLTTTKLLTITSPTLKQIVRKANFESHNLITESVLKALSLKNNDKQSSAQGIAYIYEYLKRKNLDVNNIILHDGSGLSPRNYISSHDLSQFLLEYSKSLEIENLIKFIPQTSYDGTVRNLLKGSVAEGKFWLKSGSMEGVQSYSGFVKSKTNKWYAFSFINNGFSVKGYKMRKEMELVMIKIYDSLP